MNSPVTEILEEAVRVSRIAKGKGSVKFCVETALVATRIDSDLRTITWKRLARQGWLDNRLHPDPLAQPMTELNEFGQRVPTTRGTSCMVRRMRAALPSVLAGYDFAAYPEDKEYELGGE